MSETAAQAVDDFVARGVFRADGPKRRAATTVVWAVRWFGDHMMTLSAGPASVAFDDVLPPLPAQSPLYRELRAWLRAQQAAELPAHRRLDPARWPLEVKNRGGRLRIALGAQAPDGEAVRRLVQLVHALYLEFLGGPGRLHWVIDAFGLDPDNPRLR